MPDENSFNRLVELCGLQCLQNRITQTLGRMHVSFGMGARADDAVYSIKRTHYTLIHAAFHH